MVRVSKMSNRKENFVNEKLHGFIDEINLVSCCKNLDNKMHKSCFVWVKLRKGE